MSKINRREKNVIFAVGMLLLFLSAPLTMDYLPASSRLGIFFLETDGVRGPFLGLLMVLHGLGMSTETCCRLYILIANMGTLLTSCYCFTKMAENVYAGIAGSFCYGFSVYSVYMRYTEGSLGGITAFVFLPFVLYGMWSLYREEPERKGCIKAALSLFFGLFGVFVSHIPTAMITMGGLVLAAIVLFRRTFRKKTLAALCSAVPAALAVSAFCWIPYGRAMLTGAVYADSAAGASFALRGLSLAKLLLPFLGRSRNLEVPLTPQEYCGLGLPFLCIAVFWMVWVLLMRDKAEQKIKQEMGFCIGLSAVSVFFATELMPWERVAGIHRIVRALLEHVGYPYRFTVIAVLLLSAAVSLLGKAVWKRGRRAMAVFLLVVTVTNVLSGVYLMNAQIYTSERIDSFDVEEGYQNAGYLFYLGE